MRSSRLPIVALVVLSFLTMLASGALACDKKGAKASTASASCCMKGAQATTASVTCPKGAQATAASACPMSAKAQTASACMGSKNCTGKCTVSFDTERVSPNQLVVRYHGQTTDAVAMLHSKANGEVADFSCPLAQKMITAQNCKLEMKSIDDGVEFIATSNDGALLDGFAQNYEVAAATHAQPKSDKEKKSETPEKTEARSGV